MRKSALLLALSLGLVGCGTSTTKGEGAGVDFADITVDARITAVAEEMFGDVDERRAGEILFYRSAQDAIETCLAEKGYTYPRPPFIDIYEGWSDAQATSSLSGWLRPLGADLNVANGAEISFRETEAQVANGVPGAEDDLGPGYHEANDACAEKAYAAQVEPFPVEIDDHFGEFMVLFDNLESRPTLKPLMSTYSACMRTAGFNVANPDELVEVVAQELTPLTFQENGLAELRAYEDDAVQADGLCRAPIVAEVNKLVVDDVVSYAESHQSEIRAAQSAWADYVRRAKQYSEWNS